MFGVGLYGVGNYQRATAYTPVQTYADVIQDNTGTWASVDTTNLDWDDVQDGILNWDDVTNEDSNNWTTT